MKRGFVFAAEPQPVGVATLNRTKPKYREPFSKTKVNPVEFESKTAEDEEAMNNNVNIMIDKRVVRGGTYSVHPNSLISANASTIHPSSPHKNHSSASKGRDALLRSKASYSNSNKTAPYLLSSPRSMYPYKSEEKQEYQFTNEIFTQTDSCFEELDEDMVEKDCTTQTDFPTTEQEQEERRQQKLIRNVFYPYPRGIDASTEILDGELFCWEDAVEIILEVVVGKSLDQALIEVREEEEYAKWEAQRYKFAHERDELLAEAQHLEHEAIRREEEKNIRINQRQKRLEEVEKTNQNHRMMKLAQDFALALQEETWKNLESQGAFVHCVDTDVRNIFLPMLSQTIASQVATYDNTRATLDAFVSGAVVMVAEEKQRLLEADEQRRKEAEEERLRKEYDRLAEVKRIEEEKYAERLQEEQAALEAQRLAEPEVANTDLLESTDEVENKEDVVEVETQ